MTLDNLISNLETYELKLSEDRLDRQSAESLKPKNLVLKTTQKQDIEEDDMVLLTRCFRWMLQVWKERPLHQNFPLWETKWKSNNPGNAKQ